MTDYIDSLDPDQKVAVLADPVPTVILAGAGSGKTRVLTCRVAHQIDTGICLPEQMFVSAFTKAASEEMQERVAKLSDADDLVVGTFHSLMYRFMNQERRALGLETLGVCKEYQRTKTIEGLLAKPSKDFPDAINADVDLGIVSNYIGQWKNELIACTDEEIAETVEDAPEGSDMWAAAMIYPLYEDRLRILHLLDFDDMLKMSYEMLRDYPKARQQAQAQWRAFFVDEAQDTNKAQWEIIKLIAPPKESPNITIVGDQRQCLYGFRGAHPELMDEFGKIYKGARKIDLTRNYRSKPAVVKHANNLIRSFGLPDQNSHRNGGSDPQAWFFRDPRHQAVEIAQLVTEVRDSGRKGGDMAVLIRTNAQSADIESAFVASKIPYWCQSGGFFDRMEIGDIMAYLRLALDHTNVEALNKIINKPTRYLGKVFVEAVLSKSRSTDGDLVKALPLTKAYNGRKLWAKQLEAARDLANLLNKISPSDGSLINPVIAIQTILDTTDYIDWLRKTTGTSIGADDSRKENIDALIDIATQHGSLQSLISFADEATALQTKSNDATEICTVHRAKGREWPIVIATNFHDDSIPHKMAQREGTVREERRVAYVAFTRAQDHLIVTVPMLSDRGEAVEPSRFLEDADLEVDYPEDGWYKSVLTP